MDLAEDLEGKRLADSVETAVGLADGIVEIEILPARDAAPDEASSILTFSEKFACLNCGTSMPELEPRIFSFNSPHGACERCTGLGHQMEIDPELVVPDPSLSIAGGALADPLVACDLSFMLSAGATAGLIGLNRPISRLIVRGPAILRKLLEPIATTLAAMLGCAPLLLINGGAFPVLGIAANVVAPGAIETDFTSEALERPGVKAQQISRRRRRHVLVPGRYREQGAWGLGAAEEK